MNNEVVLGIVQMSMASDPSVNLRKAAAMVREAAEGGAQIVCLPELFSTPYFPQHDINSASERDKAPHDDPRMVSDACPSVARTTTPCWWAIRRRTGRRHFSTPP